MDNRTPDNGWHENRKYVLSAIAEVKQDIKEGFDDVNDKISRLSADVISLKTKAGLWGGLIGGILTLAGSFIFNKIFKI